MSRAAQPWVQRNQLKRAKEGIGVEARGVPGVGHGLFATRPFRPGEVVTTFFGKVTSREKLGQLYETNRAEYERINDYGIDAGGGHLCPEPADMDKVGGHLVNHSCGPNCEFVTKLGVPMVRAVKPIAVGEEVTAFYGWLGVKSAMEKKWHECLCGKPYCPGTIELKVEWFGDLEDSGDGIVGGPNLTEEEAGKRVLADVANHTSEHFRLMVGYARNSQSMCIGAKVQEPIDDAQFYKKLARAARGALGQALTIVSVEGGSKERLAFFTKLARSLL